MTANNYDQKNLQEQNQTPILNNTNCPKIHALRLGSCKLLISIHKKSTKGTLTFEITMSCKIFQTTARKVFFYIYRQVWWSISPIRVYQNSNFLCNQTYLFNYIFPVLTILICEFPFKCLSHDFCLRIGQSRCAITVAFKHIRNMHHIRKIAEI